MNGIELCSETIWALSKARIITMMPSSLAILAGGSVGQITQKTKIEEITEALFFYLLLGIERFSYEAQVKLPSPKTFFPSRLY
jgi:hypothetical protein